MSEKEKSVPDVKSNPIPKPPRLQGQLIKDGGGGGPGIAFLVGLAIIIIQLAHTC